MTGLKQSAGTLTAALKEWHVAVQAIAAGDTILLLRKGGIREEEGRFRVKSDRVLLFPTYEHQKPHLLKPNYADAVQAVEPGWHPSAFEIAAWAEIGEVIEVDDSESLTRLLPFHIWNEQFVSERFNWKPSQPLYLLLLRAYTLPHPVEIPYSPMYGGCRSWINLSDEIDLDGSQSVLSDGAYTAMVAAIQAAVTPSSHSAT